MTFIETGLSLFGRTIDDPEIIALADSQGEWTMDKPNDGVQHILSREHGFELTFEDDGSKGRRQHRVLSAIFVYAEGRQKYRQFTGTLPLGIEFGMPRSEIIKLRAPNRTWVIGEGRVSLDHPDPDSDTWVLDDCNLFITYDAGAICYLTLTARQELDPDTEYKRPENWQDMARDPSRLAEAIAAYRKEYPVGMAEAKAAIEAFRASTD